MDFLIFFFFSLFRRSDIPHVIHNHVHNIWVCARVIKLRNYIYRRRVLEILYAARVNVG